VGDDDDDNDDADDYDDDDDGEVICDVCSEAISEGDMMFMCESCDIVVCEECGVGHEPRTFSEEKEPCCHALERLDMGDDSSENETMNRAKAERGSRAKADRGSRAKAERGSRAKVERGSRAKAERGSRAKAERGSRAKAERGSRAKAERGSRAKAERGSRARGERVNRARGERVNRARGERVNRARGERVNRARGERKEDRTLGAHAMQQGANARGQRSSILNDPLTMMQDGNSGTANIELQEIGINPLTGVVEEEGYI